MRKRVTNRFWPLLFALLPFVLTACPSTTGPAGAPNIVSFTADPATITAPGQEVRLSWEIVGAVTGLELDPVGTVTGSSVTVNPTGTTTYTLTASNGSGSATETVQVTLGTGGGEPGGDSEAPEGTFGVSLSQNGPFESDQGGNINGPSDPRIVRVQQGDTFYALVSYSDPGGITGVTIRLVNSAPPGLQADLVQGQEVSGFTLVGEVNNCVLDGTQTTVNCVYEIAVGDVPNITELPNSGTEFAYVFRTIVLDTEGNGAASISNRGYVIVGDDGGTPNPPVDPDPPVDPGPPVNRAPTANFTFDQQDDSLVVAFSGAASSDPDGDALSYEWDFGDGTDASTRDFRKTYGEADDYTVSLTVTDPDGESDTETETVTVEPVGGGGGDDNEDPTVVINGASQRSATVGESQSLTATTTDPDDDDLTFEWSVTDGDEDSVDFGDASDEDTTVTFSEEGEYTLTLTADDGNGGAASDTVAFDVEEDDGGGTQPTAPVASFDYEPEQVVVNSKVTLDGTASSDPDGGNITAYAWTVTGPNGGRPFTGLEPTFRPLSEGDYTVSLVVTDDEGTKSAAVTETIEVEEGDDDGDGDGTPVTPTHTLSVGKEGMGVGSIISDPAGIGCGEDCPSATGTYDANAVVTLRVQEAPGSTFEGWSGADCTGTGTCQVAMTEDHTVIAIFGEASAPPGNGEGSDLQADFEYEVSDATVTFTSTTEGSNGEVLSYSWDFGDGELGNGSVTEHTYAEAGTYNVFLTARTGDGAASRVGKSVTVPQ